MKNLIVFCILSLCISTGAMAADKNKAVQTDDFRCAKLLSTPLTDFKAALLENCDLNKPFSTSLSRLLNEDTYFYCCHKK